MRPGSLGPSCHHQLWELGGTLVRDTWKLVSTSCPIAGPAGSMATSWAQCPQATWRRSSPVAQVRAVHCQPGAARPGGAARGDTGGRLARGVDRPAGMAGCPGLTHSQRPHAPRPSTEPAAGAQRAEARTPPADSASGLGQRGAGTGRPQAATAQKPGTRRRATPPAHGACARAASRATQRSGARNCRAERAGPTHAETLRTAGNAVRSSIS